MKTRQEAKDVFNKLNMEQKNAIVTALMRTRQEYLVGISQVRFPQFFYACYQEVFEGLPEEEFKAFIDIDDGNIFVDQAFFYMAVFLTKREAQKGAQNV